MSEETTQPQGDAAPGTAPDKVETKTAKTYTEEEVQRKLGGSGKEILKLREELTAKETQLADLANRAKAIEEALATKEKEATAKIAEAERRFQKAEIFRDVYGKHLVDGVDQNWLPEGVFEVKDGKLTPEAEAAFTKFIEAKPALRRQGNGIPRTTGADSAPSPTGFSAMFERNAK